jgi:hypothetical protein
LSELGARFSTAARDLLLADPTFGASVSTEKQRESGPPPIDWGTDTAPACALPPVITGAQLYESKAVKLPMLLDGVLWSGLTMLVAPPKAGKSWLTLQLAVHVAGGPQVDGVSAKDAGPVVYCALEEPSSRTKSRLDKIAPFGPWAANLHFVYDVLPLMGGGAEQLSALVESIKPKLLVVDTWTALVKAGGKSGSDVFRSQYAEVSQLRKLAEVFQLAVVVVHHTRKGISNGAIEAVAGTGGIAAAVDCVWQLKRKPEGEAQLDIVGRETEDRSLAMKFEQDPFGWIVLGDDDAQLANGERRQVIELLREEGAMTPAQIAMELAKSRPAVRMLLKRMRADNQVQKQGTKYIPTHTVSYRVTE